MDKKLKRVIVLNIVLIFFFILLLNHLEVLRFMNDYVSGTPDKSCAVDADCALKPTTCGYGVCGDAVNKNWNAFCPFKDSFVPEILFEPCPSPDKFQIKCVDNQCQKVWMNE